MLNFTLYDAIAASYRWRTDDAARTIIINVDGMPVHARLGDVACAAFGERNTPIPITIEQAEEIARVLNVTAAATCIPAPDLLAVCTWKSLADAVTAHRGSGIGWEIRAVHAAIRRWRHTNALWNNVIYAVDDARLPAAA